MKFKGQGLYKYRWEGHVSIIRNIKHIYFLIVTLRNNITLVYIYSLIQRLTDTYYARLYRNTLGNINQFNDIYYLFIEFSMSTV